MVCEIARKVVGWQLGIGSFSEEDTELYQYGYEIFFSYLFNLIIAGIIAVCFSSYLEVATFFVAYSVLRAFAGGYHARDYEKCMVVSGFILVLFCFLMRSTPTGLYVPVGVVCLTLSVPVIWRVVPVEDPNKPLDALELTVYRKKARRILSVEVILAIIGFFCGLQKISIAVSLSLLILSITLLMGVIKNRKLHRLEDRPV